MRRLLIVTCLLGMAPVSWAGTNRGSWEGLESLRAGQKIEVVETSLKKHSGTFLTVSDEAIQLREGATDEAIKKENVMRVTSLENSHHARNALIFGAVGAGVGAGIGAAAYHSCTAQSFCIVDARGITTGVGAVIGLAGGAVVGAVLPSHDTIYRAKPN